MHLQVSLVTSAGSTFVECRRPQILCMLLSFVTFLPCFRKSPRTVTGIPVGQQMISECWQLYCKISIMDNFAILFDFARSICPFLNWMIGWKLSFLICLPSINEQSLYEGWKACSLIHGFCYSSSKKIPLQCQSSSVAGSSRNCGDPLWKRESFKVSAKRLKGEKFRLGLI